MDKLKLEVDKAYRTRDGHKAVVLEKMHYDVWPLFVVAIQSAHKDWYIECVTIEGRISNSEPKYNSDLVEEWVEPLEFHWGCLPAWCDKAIAMDGNGKWLCYSDVPKVLHGREWQTTEFCYEIHSSFYPKNFTGSYKDSLFVNPKYKE